MEQYIEFIKTHLPDIMSFILIAIVALYQFVSRLRNAKTNLLAKTFFAEKTNTVNAAYADFITVTADLKKQATELKAENSTLKERLHKAEQAILTICSPTVIIENGSASTDHQDKEGA